MILNNLGRIDKFVSSGERRWMVTHNDASRVMLESYLSREYFDLIDVDSFGSDSGFVRSAVLSVRDGGLLYLTSTDGFSSGGHRPYNSLAAYGAYIRPMPYSNEVGLRMLIGGALREAVALGFQVSPLFSYYSYHGPIFRVMLQVSRGKFHENSHYGFICYCNKCGHSQTIPWGELGKISCPCRHEMVSGNLIISGPLWTGPLHDTSFVTDMLNLARDWRWANTKETGVDLEKLLKQMIDESHPNLPSGYIELDEISKRGKINSPPINTIIDSLRKEGYAVSRSHIKPNAIKTNCPMSACIQIARDLYQPLSPSQPFLHSL